MEHIIGGWVKNPNLMIKKAIEYFDKMYSQSFDFEGIKEQNYFMGIIKEKLAKRNEAGFIFENNSIFKSSYYDKIPKVLKNNKENLDYDKEVIELKNDFIYAVYKENKGVRVYVDKFAREKIYYTIQKPYLFSSSYKFLLSLIDNKKINYDVLTRFLIFGVNLGKYTIFKNIKRLDFGEYLQIFKNEFSIFRYWTLNKEFFKISRHDVNDIQFWIDYIYNILKQTLDFQRNDIFTSLMSGGLDSTIMTAILLKEFNLPINALTIEIPGYSEIDVEKARSVSQYLNLPHTIKKMELEYSNHLKNSYLEIFNILEEPVGGSAYISRYFAYKEAKNIGNKNIIVGDGADQIFAYKGKFILKNLKYINYKYKIPIKLRYHLIKFLHRFNNLALHVFNFSNNKDFIDSFDVIMKSDFLQSKNQFQSFYCAYQFSSLDELFKMTNYKINLDRYLAPFLRNHSYYPFNDYNRIGFNTVIFCINSDNLLNKALANYYDLNLFTPFILDIPLKNILPIPPSLKMINPKSKWILMEMAKKKKLLPDNYFKIESKKKYGLYQQFLEMSSFETTISYILDLLELNKHSPLLPVKHFIKYFQNVSFDKINKHTSEYMKFNIWFGFLGWLNSIKPLDL